MASVFNVPSIWKLMGAADPFLAQGDSILPLHSLVLHAIHDLPDQVDSEAADFPLLQRQVQRRRGMQGRVEFPPVILNLRHELVFLERQTDYELTLSASKVTVLNYVGDYLVEGQDQLVLDVGGDPLTRAK